MANGHRKSSPHSKQYNIDLSVIDICMPLTCGKQWSQGCMRESESRPPFRNKIIFKNSGVCSNCSKTISWRTFKGNEIYSINCSDQLYQAKKTPINWDVSLRDCWINEPAIKNQQ